MNICWEKINSLNISEYFQELVPNYWLRDTLEIIVYSYLMGSNIPS